jgi:hypothetical protein
MFVMFMGIPFWTFLATLICTRGELRVLREKRSRRDHSSGTRWLEEVSPPAGTARDLPPGLYTWYSTPVAVTPVGPDATDGKGVQRGQN